MNKKIQQGFTMIELVIVIAVLGILAAFALPRFTSFTSDATVSKMKSLSGTANATIGIIKAKYIASGASNNSVDLNGTTIAVTSNGDIDNTKITDVDSCTALMNSLLGNSVDNLGVTIIYSGRSVKTCAFHEPRDTTYVNDAFFNSATNSVMLMSGN